MAYPVKYLLNKTIDSKLRIGESKHLAKQQAREQYLKENGNLKGYNPSKVEGIHSIKTTEAYRQTANEFAKWLKETKDIKRVDSIKDIPKDYAKEYLQQRQEQGLSAWTTSKDMAALNKMMDYGLTKQEVGLHERRLQDITRSRGEQNNLVNLNNYKDQVNMALATGMRRDSVLRVVPEDFRKDETGKVVSVHLTEKGGKERDAIILNAYRDEITRIVNQATQNEPIFNHYPQNIDNHSFRAEYATSLYNQLVAEKTEIDTSYRGYDRECIQLVSQNLGHERLNVVVEHYLR